MPLFGLDDTDLQRACFHVYNDWLADFCAHNPKRLIGTALISLDFVKYNTPVLRRAFYHAVMDKVSAEPGVETAAFGISVPLDQAAPFLAGFIVEGHAPGDRRA